MVGRMRRDEDIVRVGGTHGERMILISWVVKVNHQGVALLTVITLAEKS